MRKTTLILAFILNGFLVSQAQFVTPIMPTYVDYSAWNPAAIAPSGLFNGGVNYATDALGADYQSRMWNVFFHYPIKFQKMAFGGHITRNNFSGLKQTQLGGGFKYNLKFAEETSLGLGIGAGVFLTSLNDDRFIALDPGDALISSDGNSSINFNINAGALFRHTIISGFASEEHKQRVIVSFSTQQILSSKQQIFDDAFEINRSQHFFTLLAYSYPLLQAVGTTFYYTNSYAPDYKMNHSLSVSFNFNHIMDLDVGYNTAGKIFVANGYSFRNIREDDRIRVKASLTYDTRSILQGSQVGMNLSILYTYDYDLTSFEM